MPCEHQFVAVEESKSVTLAGIFSVVLIIGFLVIIAAILIGMTGRKHTVVKCAKCGELSSQ